ncbi:MAG: Flp family type IVb pilin [Beijerinckiaceae bacterium]
MSKIINFLRDESGSAGIEYSMLGVLISVLLVGAMTNVGNATNTYFSSISSGFK